MSKNLSQSVQEIIKDKKIEPRPKWEFKFKEYTVWLGAFSFAIIGGLAMAVIIYMLKNNDWDLSKQASHSFLGFIFITLPYFWILLLVLFSLFTYYNFEHTKRGYRYGLSYILLGIILISLFLGIVFYNIGLGRVMDNIFFNRMPFYEKIMSHRQNIWLKPNQGLLAGKIISEVINDEFELSGLDRKIWLIRKSKAFVSPIIILKLGEPIKIIGEQIDNNIFQAKEIRPLLGPRHPSLPRPGMRMFFQDER